MLWLPYSYSLENPIFGVILHKLIINLCYDKIIFYYKHLMLLLRYLWPNEAMFDLTCNTSTFIYSACNHACTRPLI